MKKYILLSFLIGMCYVSKAQWVTDHIDFQTPVDSILTIDTTAGNIWQIGKPRKTFFDSGYNGPFAIVTDTINPYPINNTSSFVFKMHGPWSPFLQALDFSFEHKYDMDSLGDKGYLQLSVNDTNWFNIVGNDYYPNYNDSSIAFEIFNNQYDGNSTEFFTGKSNGWVKTEISSCLGDNIFHNFTLDDPLDTIYIRFVFKSDSIQTNKEGWEIGDIAWESFVCEGVETINPNNFTFTPNPANNILSLTNYSTKAKQVTVINLIGQIVYSQPITYNGQTDINISQLPPGLFFVMLQSANGAVAAKKFIKN